MANISFKRGSNLNNLAITDGQFIVNTAERSIYVDVGTERLRIGDFVSVANIDALPAAGGHTTALYYVEDINCLAKWDGSSWIQINRDTGVKEVKVEGTGNAITAASYDATTRILTLTKGATYMTAADVDGKINTKVGELKIGETSYDTVKAYVDQKTSGIATDEALTALGTRVTTAEGKLETLTGADTVEGSVAKALKDAKTYTDEKDTAMDARMDTVEGSITTLNGEESVAGSVKAIAKSYADGKDAAIQAAQAAADAAQDDVDTLENKVGTVADGKTVVGLISDAQTQANKGVTDAATAKSAADAAQADVNALEAKVGEVPADKTVVQMISDAQDAATYDDTALKNRISANETAIATLNGTGDGSVSKQVADAVAQIVADAPEAYDTLKEISDWISSHASDASAMNSQINTNKTDIANLTALVGTLPETATSNTVIGYIDEAIAALQIDDYAKATDLAAAVARIGTAEGKITTLEGKVKAIEDKNISDGANKVEASTTNGNIKIDGVETIVYTHPAEHTISEVTGLQTALDAKATQTSLNATNANVTANANAITALQNGKADKATTLSGYGITDAYTSSETDQKITDALSANVFTIPITMTSASSGVTATTPDTVIDAFNKNKQIVLDIDGQMLYSDSVTVSGSEVTVVATYDFNDNNSLSDDIGYSTFTLTGTSGNSLIVYLDQNNVTGLTINDTTYKPLSTNGGTINFTDTINSMIDAKISSATGGESAASVKAALDSYKTSNDARVDALEADTHTHGNKTVLDGITAEKVSAWDSAESNAKSYTDALANGQVATNKTNIASLQSGKADKATTLSGYGITDAYTKDEVQALLTWGEF